MSDQLQPDDTLEDRGVEDVLDEGYSPPDREPHNLSDPAYAGGESTLDDELASEEPEVWANDPSPDEPLADISDEDGDLPDPRSGRLVSPGGEDSPDVTSELIGSDVGIDGAGASAEEAAVHTVEEPDQG